MTRAKCKPPKAVVRCEGCGCPEKKDPLGFTNIAPYSGYCTECLNTAMKQVAAEQPDAWQRGALQPS